MRKLILSAITLIAVVGISGCGGNNTYSPSFQGGGGGGSFTLSGKPASNNAVQGLSANYTITATSTGGFSSSAGLSVSGLPAGASAAFNPTSVTPSAGGANSTLTVSTSGPTTGSLTGTIRAVQPSVTPTGTYTLTVTGTGGGITQSTTVQLVVQAPTTPFFTIQAGDSQTRQQGGNGNYDFTVTSVNGFAGTVTFSVPNTPPGSTVTFFPTSVTLSANGTAGGNIDIQTSLNTPPATYTPAIKGTSGTLTNQATETLIITPGGEG